MNIESPLTLCNAVEDLLRFPRGAQLERLRQLLEQVQLPVDEEDWNTHFGVRSLFEAWTHTGLVSGLYDGIAKVLSEVMRPGWRGLEVGGGDGQLWRVLREQYEVPQGCLVLVDPAEAVHDEVRAALPPGVELQSIVGPVESSLEPLTLMAPVDFALCSLTLHHVAGRDAQQRRGRVKQRRLGHGNPRP